MNDRHEILRDKQFWLMLVTRRGEVLIGDLALDMDRKELTF
jgi:hypothetical protein